MALSDFQPYQPAVALLQRSLKRGRVGHAYLLTGDDLSQLDRLATSLAKTVNCQSPPESGDDGTPLDACDRCDNCLKIGRKRHADLHWLRPESKMRVVTLEQVRGLMEEIHLKPNAAAFKIGVIEGADRLNTQSANAFLKTLEEPPARSILLLLTTEPYRILDTIESRCLRLSLSGDGFSFDKPLKDWLAEFSRHASGGAEGLLNRYLLLDSLLGELSRIRQRVEDEVRKDWELHEHEELDSKVQEQRTQGMNAAIEAEYRRHRGELLIGLEWWLRDVWLRCLGLDSEPLAFPELLSQTDEISRRVSVEEAARNLRVVEETFQWLHSNVQEALTLEVGLLKMKF